PCRVSRARRCWTAGVIQILCPPRGISCIEGARIIGAEVELLPTSSGRAIGGVTKGKAEVQGRHGTHLRGPLLREAKAAFRGQRGAGTVWSVRPPHHPT